MKLRAAFLAAFCLMASVCCSAARPAQSPDVRQAIAQLREFYLGPADGLAMQDTNEPLPDPKAAFKYLATLRPDGTWPDINYAGNTRSGWQPAIHFQRITAMTFTAMRPDHAVTGAQRAQLLDGIHRAFAFWMQRDFQCPNWWYNDIGTPKALGLDGLLLGDQLNDAEYSYLADKLLARHPVAMTGQNRVWLAGNALYRALLRGDETALAQNSAVIWDELRVTTDEGVQADNSFHQHGAQQQFGNYGMSFAVETCRWGLFLRGTPWAMPAEKLAIHRAYLLDGLNWTCWRGAMDISACGRQLMPRSPRSKAENISRVMKQSAVIDPARAADYLRFVARNKPVSVSVSSEATGSATRATRPPLPPLPPRSPLTPLTPDDLTGDKYFWRSDYLVHRAPQFMATLKMSSRRVVGAELVNYENLSGYRIADGALYLYRTGNEYAEIFPVWDWRKIPGITAPQTPLPNYQHSSLDTDLVGAVSDGAHAIAMLRQSRKNENLVANKAWFFCADSGSDVESDGGKSEILCLGAGITGQSGAGIATDINQCNLNGKVSVHKKQGEHPAPSRGDGSSPHFEDAADGIEYIEHDGWRYTLLDTGGAAVKLQTGKVTGNWSKVFKTPETPKADVTREIFNLWLDHGAAPANATYAYALTLAGNAPVAKPLRNTPALQLVRMAPALYGVIFWQPGRAEIPDGPGGGTGNVPEDGPGNAVTLTADHACLVLLDMTARTLCVAEPTQKISRLTLTFNGKPVSVALPAGAMAGSTAKAKLPW